MHETRNQKFDQRQIPIDGGRFVECVFSECKLIFSASAPVWFHRCTFIDCEWVFEGAALATLQFMAALNDGLDMEGEKLTESIFMSVKEGVLGTTLFPPEPVQVA